MKGNPHCPACAGTGRTYSQRPQDRAPEWRDCDMLPLPGGEAVNAAVAEDLRRTVEAIAAGAAEADKPAEQESEGIPQQSGAGAPMAATDPAPSWQEWRPALDRPAPRAKPERPVSTAAVSDP